MPRDDRPKRPDAPLSKRELDLEGLTGDEFEALAHRVVRAAYPDAQKVAPPDHGADTLLPYTSGGWKRAWQAKHFTAKTGPKWKQYEDALDDAVATYGIEHYTFVFPRDLTGPQLLKFEERLVGRHKGVTVDWWGLTELLEQLNETRQGRRVARLFFGPSREEDQKEMRDAIALGQLDMGDANDVFARLRVLGSWLARSDPDWTYATASWETGEPDAETPAPKGAVISRVHVDELMTSRIDAVLRKSASGDVQMPSVDVYAQDNEAGRRAAEAIANLHLATGRVVIDGGVEVRMHNLPGQWSDDEGVLTVPCQLIFDPVDPTPPLSRRSFLQMTTGSGERATVDIELTPVNENGWTAALTGTRAGLSVQSRIRSTAEGGEMQLKLGFDLKLSGPTNQQVEALQLLLAFQRGGELVLGDRDDPELNIPLTVEPGPEPAGIRSLLEVLEAIAFIEDRTGNRFDVRPHDLSEEDVRDISFVAHALRKHEFPARVPGDLRVKVTKKQAATLAKDGVVFKVQEETSYRMLGQEVYLGIATYDIERFEVAPDPKPGWSRLVPPDDGRALRATLEPGRLEGQPLPEGIRSLNTERTGG